MIYTLTLSPSIDYFITGDKFSLEKVNRFSEFELFPGGKGLNASVVMQRHGFDNQAISFFDPQSFLLINSLCQKDQIQIHNISSQTPTRINVKYYGTNTNFELNGPRLVLEPEQKTKLWQHLEQLVANDVLLIMGVGDPDLVTQLIQFCRQKKIQFILDIDNPALKDFVQWKPFLIKPNLDELKNIFHLDIKNENDVLFALEHLQKLGCINAMISFDKSGAYLIDQTGAIYRSEIVHKLDPVVSSTGAGDTLISMFAAHYLKYHDAKKAFHFASAAAMGTVSQRYLTTEALTKKYLDHIKIVRLK